MAIKLSKVARLKTEAVPLELKDLDGELLQDENGEKVVAWLYGRASKAQRDYEDKGLKKSLEKMKKAKGSQAALADGVTVESIRDNGLDHPVAMTAKITGLETEDGKPYDNEKAIRSLYEDEGLAYIKDQVVAFLNDDKNFI